MRRLAQHADKLISLALAFASCALYLRTLAPDVVDADGGEFQFAAWNFGFVHPTGYPLFLILGGAFQHLVALGNPAYRLNLFTAITGVLAVAMVYLVVYEITRQRGAAILAAAAFALTRTFWYDASATEIYALNAFFIAMLIYIALRWRAEPSAQKFAAFCFAFGLALTHHRTIVLWVPAFVLFLAVSGFRFQVSRITHYFLLFTLPFLLYLYIPLRAPASPYYTLALAPGRDLILYDNSVSGFINYVLGRTFQSELAWDATSVARLLALPQLLLDQFGVLGVAFGVIGLGAMIWRREGAQLVLLLTGFVATILFASIYHIGDIAHYYIPAYLVWAGWMGVGVAELVKHGTRHTQYVVRGACSVLLIVQLVSNFPFADRSGETRVREHWTRLLAFASPNTILISNDRDEMMPLWYIQYVENTRRDVLGLFPLITPAPAHANVGRLTDSVLDTGRPIYFIKPMPGLEIKYQLESAEPLVRVLGRAAVTPHNLSNAIVGNRVRVLGYDAVRESDVLRVTIYWHLLAKLDHDYTTFVHLLDAQGNKVAQGDDHQVGGEFYPTSLWQVGETLRDEFMIPLPSNLAHDTYRLLVGMYHPPGGEMLGEPVMMGTVEIK